MTFKTELPQASCHSFCELVFVALMAAPEPKAEIDSIRQAVARGDWVALEAYGDLNGTLRRMRDLSAAVTGRPAIASGQIWRSMQVPT